MLILSLMFIFHKKVWIFKITPTLTIGKLCFIMLKFKLWYIQQNRNQKCEGCKNGGIYQNLWSTLSKLNFGHFVSIIILPPFCWGKTDLKKHCLGEMGNFRLPEVVIRIWGRVLLGDMSKNEQIQLFNSNVLSSNLNTKNLKLSLNHGNHGRIYRSAKKFKKYSG